MEVNEKYPGEGEHNEQAIADARIVLDKKGFHSDKTGLPSQNLIQKAKEMEAAHTKRQEDTK